MFFIPVGGLEHHTFNIKLKEAMEEDKQDASHYPSSRSPHMAKAIFKYLHILQII